MLLAVATGLLFGGVEAALIVTIRVSSAVSLRGLCLPILDELGVLLCALSCGRGERMLTCRL